MPDRVVGERQWAEHEVAADQHGDRGRLQSNVLTFHEEELSGCSSSMYQDVPGRAKTPTVR